MLIVVPILIMAVFVVIITVWKAAIYRANKKRKAQNLPPITEEEYPVNVIDWTRRR